MNRIQKDFPSYSMPSEAANYVSNLAGQSILKLYLGALSDCEDEKLPSPKCITSAYVALSSQVVIQFRLDGGAGSLTMNFLGSVDVDTLFQRIEQSESSFPPFFRTKHLIDVTTGFPGLGVINSVAAYKLPDNFGVEFAKSMQRNERIVSFSLDCGHDLLVVARVTERSFVCPDFAVWDDVPRSFPSELLERVF